MKIIFAQGNPEPDYMNTRHNIGFNVLNAIAERLNAKWTPQSKFSALIAEVSIAGEKVLLVKPTTFYNETGLSARKIIDFYKLDQTNDFIVVHDDLSLPFGTIRVRDQGSDAGNNGIKSLNSHLGQNYKRIRVGIYHDARELMNDADYVLSKISAEELKQLSEKIIPQTVELIYDFINSTLAPTSQTTI